MSREKDSARKAFVVKKLDMQLHSSERPGRSATQESNP